MTIRKGSEWGLPRKGGLSDQKVTSDSELARLAYEAYLNHSDLEPPLFSPASGDVLRTLGVVEQQRSHSEQVVFPFDLGLIRLDGGESMPFVAHVIVRNRLWSGHFATIMNVGWSNDNYFGPKAHPNDGLLDIMQGSLSPQQRILARGRVKNGSHLPHPNLKTSRRSSHTLVFDRPTRTFIDDVLVGRHSSVEVEVVADAIWVVA